VRQLIEMSSREFDIAPLLHSMLGMNLPMWQCSRDKCEGARTITSASSQNSLRRVSLTVTLQLSTNFPTALASYCVELPTARRHAVASGFSFAANQACFCGDSPGPCDPISG